MKLFRFHLEAVLEMRRAQETEARLHLALALEKHSEATARSREAVQVLNLLLLEIGTASAGRFSVANRERFWSMRRAQDRLCAELRAAAQECAKVVEARRHAVLQARSNRELLERLKRAQQQAWEKEAARLEQHQLDEFAMTRRHQTAQQDPALC